MPLSPTVAMLPETPDSRLLAELSSYLDDVSEASDAIEQALEAGHESPLWQPLTSYAVVAYMRAFAHSNGATHRTRMLFKGNKHAHMARMALLAVFAAGSSLSFAAPLAPYTDTTTVAVVPANGMALVSASADARQAETCCDSERLPRQPFMAAQL